MGRELPQLVRGLLARWSSSHPDMCDLARAQVDDEESEDRAKPDIVGLDEVAGPDLICVVAQERRPVLAHGRGPRTPRMYFWMVRLLTRMPSLSSSPRMRSAPQRRFSRSIRWMSWTVSGTRRGSHRRERDLHRQKRRKPCRCHLRTVSGFTSSTVSCQVRVIAASATITARSCLRSRGRFAWRRTTISC